MAVVAAAVSGLSLTVIIIVSIILFHNTDNVKKNTEESMKSIVDQINDAQYYAYKFDKNQEDILNKNKQYMQKLDRNTNETNARMTAHVAKINTDMNQLRSDSVLKKEINAGIPFAKIGTIQLGDDYTLRGANGVVSIKNKDFSKDHGIAVSRITSTQNATFNGPMNITGDTNIVGNVTISGGVSEWNPQRLATTFNTSSDKKNYIAGDTIIRGNTDNKGDMNIGRNMNVQGRLHFKDSTYDTKSSLEANSSDSYYLEKKIDSLNSSSLRLTLKDDNDESFQIWGGSCATGDCEGEGKMKHKLSVDGNLWTAGNIDSQSIAGRDSVRSGQSYMSSTGNVYVPNKIGVGVDPVNSPHKLNIADNTQGEWAGKISNGSTSVLIAHGNGNGLRIQNSKSSTENALDVYSANGELLRVASNGIVQVGKEDGSGLTDLRSRNLTIGRPHQNVGASIYLAGTGGDEGWDHTVIESRTWGGNDKSELLLFKGNDPKNGCSGDCGPDRVRIRAAEIDFDVYKDHTTDRNSENIVAKVTADRIVTPKIQLGDKFLLSGVGDVANNDEWLRLINKDNTGYYGGFASAKMWTANGAVTGSDARMKRDITDVSVADKERLMELKPKKYVMKDSGKRDYGFIAQDVEKVYPDLVQDGPNGLKSLNYSGILPLVVENIKDIRKTVPSQNKLCIGDTCMDEKEFIKLKKVLSGV